jgi:hypothetical protein
MGPPELCGQSGLDAGLDLPHKSLFSCVSKSHDRLVKISESVFKASRMLNRGWRLIHPRVEC